MVDFKDQDGNKSKMMINEIVIKQAFKAKSEIDAHLTETNGPGGQSSYIFDIYLAKEPTYNVKIIDISSWNQGSSLLFDWYTLNNTDVDDPSFEVQFRVTTTKNGIFVNDEEN